MSRRQKFGVLSDRHMLAFAQSPGIGFHHASFMVREPDEIGRAGRWLVDKTGKGDRGFGRHTGGSNFLGSLGGVV
ncbi:MAG: hypothetical protein CFE35_17840 [Novosphingobium sp. PASSN1]|nr:MAG: hypothetical protein CFE35_17840 [Novosphingobium sp. PASSN1]